YLKAGRHAYNKYLGLGVYAPTIWQVDKWRLGLRFDAWRHPQLLLCMGSISLLNIPIYVDPSEVDPLYSSSQQHKMTQGLALSGILSWNLNEVCGFSGEFGGKTKGFLPGYSLWAAATVRGS